MPEKNWRIHVFEFLAAPAFLWLGFWGKVLDIEIRAEHGHEED